MARVTRSPIHRDLRTPKYRKRVVKDKRKEATRLACRKHRRVK